jgi:hypothetical protein
MRTPNAVIDPMTMCFGADAALVAFATLLGLMILRALRSRWRGRTRE